MSIFSVQQLKKKSSFKANEIIMTFTLKRVFLQTKVNIKKAPAVFFQVVIVSAKR